MPVEPVDVVEPLIIGSLPAYGACGVSGDVDEGIVFWSHMHLFK